MGVVMDSVSVVAADGDPFWAEVLEAAKHAPRQIDRLGNLATMHCGTVVVDGDGRAWPMDCVRISNHLGCRCDCGCNTEEV